MNSALRTTRPVRTVRTIDDVAEIERQPYDDLVSARNIYDLFRATAQQVGDGSAITVLRSADPTDIGAQWSHREFFAATIQAANMFHRLGLRSGQGVVAFLTPTLPELPMLLMGAQVAGIASAINYLLSQEAIVDLLNAEQATILVIPARHLDEMCWTKAVGAIDRIVTLRHVLVIGDATEGRHALIPLTQHLKDCRRDALEFAFEADRATVCALFHTGGTTGRPKLVRLTHGNQIHAAFGFAQVFGYDERDIVINGFPFFHVGGTMTLGLSVLAAGGHVVVPSPYGARSPAVVDNYWNIARAFEATVVGGVPTTIAAISNSWKAGSNLPAIRMAVTGGAVLPKAVGQRFEATTGIRLYETYGMTETAAAIAFNPGRGEPIAGSVGFRAPYSETRILRLDPNRSGICAPNESGLVQVRGPQVFPGYVDPAHNIGTLDPDGWLTTGDVGYLTDDARLVLTGREKDLIVRGGHNIDPAAIEDVANQFAGVQISAAVGMPDQYAGEVPALFVVPAPGATVDIDALRRHLDVHIQEAPARPKSIVCLDALPVTAVGKIFKPTLRELAIEEKVRQEVAKSCGAAARVKVVLHLDNRKQTEVDVEVMGATADAIANLQAALQPLAQTYHVRSIDNASTDAVTLTVDGHIATLTLNRPDSLNAASRELMTSLDEKLTVLASLTDVRVVILTGAGRAFSAGGDLIEFEAALRADKQKLLDTLRYNQDVIQRIEDIPVPVIGAANGLAVAGGLEILLCCDILIAAEGAQMGDGHTRYGVVPAGGATVRLTEKLAPAHAAQLFYTAALIDVTRLKEWGLVNEVVPKEQLMTRAVEIAREICERSPEANRHAKALIGPIAHHADRQRRIRAELDRFALHVEGQDLANGLAAFRAKKPVKF